MIDTRNFLKVPGAWLEACGYGDQERVFPVLRVEDYGDGRIVAVVDRDGHEWTVCTWLRNAFFVTRPEVK